VGPHVTLLRRDEETGRIVQVVRRGSGKAIRLAFAPDGQRLASVRTDGGVRWYDSRTGDILAEQANREPDFDTVALSTDGLLVAQTRGRERGPRPGRVGEGPPASYPVKVRALATGQEVLVLPGDRFPILDVAFSPEGSRLATMSREGPIQVWDVAT